MLVINDRGCARCANPNDHFTARADGSHATPECIFKLLKKLKRFNDMFKNW